MAELLFGSGPQVWPTIPVPGFTYFPTIPGNFPTIPGNRMLGGAPNASPTDPGPLLAPLEAPTGITPQALLAAIAVRRGQPMGPTNDQEIEDFISDALDLLPGTNDVEVRCESGRTTLTGSVSYKRVKRDVGEVVWAIPSVNDVQNNITIAARRRSRTSARDAETHALAGGGRKQT